MSKAFVPFFEKGNAMDWATYSKSVFEKCKEAGIPFQACFEMTPLCNFKCNMCYIRLDPEQAKEQGRILTTQEWIRIAEEAKKLGVVFLEVTGGEVTTRADFHEIYEKLIKMGFIIHLRTNGYLIKNETLDLIKKYKPRKVSVTMYGATDETYNKLCHIADGFTVVSKNVLAMRNAGINVRLTMTITKENENDYEALDLWAKENDMTIAPFGGLVTPVRGAKRSIDHLQVTLPDEDYIITDEQLKSVDYAISDRETLMNPFWMCRGFGAKFCISWDGRMTICNTFTSIWKEPLSNGLEKAYHDLYSDLKELKRPQKCGSCPYVEFCSACPSQLVSASGDPEQTCEAICRMARRKFKYRFLRQNNEMYETDKTYADKYEEGEDSYED